MAVQTIYDEAPLPENPAEAMAHLHSELTKLQYTFRELQESLYKILKAAPAKPREPMYAFADGTNWNPGAGRGLYLYTGGAWVKL